MVLDSQPFSSLAAQEMQFHSRGIVSWNSGQRTPDRAGASTLDFIEDIVQPLYRESERGFLSDFS